jgi:Fur family zinc uptake transcriptional regulator
MDATPLSGSISPWIAEHLATADIWCRSRGERLTARRRELLVLLLQHEGSIKAYELLQQLRRIHPTAGPPSVYRPLHFLIANGLAHRVESLNAYVACRSPEGHGLPGFMIVCSHCSAVREIVDPAASELLNDRLQRSGYLLRNTTIEVSAVCPTCAGEARSE